MNYMKKLASVVLALVFSLPAAWAQAGFGAGAVAATLAGKKVSQLVDQIRMTGVNLIAQADASGNAMISHGANEANVLAQNISFQFRDRLDESFDRLGDQEKLLLVEAEGIRLDLQKLADKAYDLKDTTALDLNALAARFPFVSDRFFVQAIRGIAYLPAAGDFQMRLFATDLGIQQDRKASVHLAIDGQPVAAVVDQSQQRGMALVTIPNGALASRFKDADLVLVPATLTVDVEKTKGWWIFSRSVKEGPFDVPLMLTLYPRTGAKVVPSGRAPRYEWVALAPRSVSKGTPDRHCSDDCRGEPTRGPNSVEMALAGGDAPVVGYQRFVPGSLSLRCTGGGGACGFAGAIQTFVTDNGAKAVATWDTWSRPTTWTLTAGVQQYQLTGDEPWKGQEVQARFGEVLAFDFPKNSTVKMLHVRTFTKREYQIAVGAADPGAVLAYGGLENMAPPAVDRHVYTVAFPQP